MSKEKELDLTKHEQEMITNAIMVVSEILLLKMDEGVESPTIEGTMDVENKDKEVLFAFTAQKK